MEGRVAFTEGPAWHAASESVFFSDIENNRIMRRMKDGTFQIFRSVSGKANGLAFDKEGRLHACEGGEKRLTRTELDGTITVLVDHFEEKRFNSTNDLAIAGDGTIYFTDPRYGNPAGMEILDSEGKGIEGVYRLDTDGKVNLVITHGVSRPNGIAISADGAFLYVAYNHNSGPGGNRKLWQFALKADRSVDLESQKLLYDWGTDRGPDGIAIGPEGFIYATAGLIFPNLPAETADKHKAGVFVIDPSAATLVRVIAVPEYMVTNCTFGGTDGKTLFITAGHKLWSLPIE